LCGETHEAKPPMFCDYCLNVTSGAYTVRRITGDKKLYYHIWHHDSEGKRLCASCYRRVLIRKKKAGLARSIYSKELLELQQVAAEIKARKAQAKAPPIPQVQIEPYLTV